MATVVGRILGLSGALSVVLLLAPGASGQTSSACGGWELEYALSANLQLSETPMGQGDGVYPIGPGRAVLRTEDRDGQPGGNVVLTAYEMREYFTVHSKTLFWSTTVVTDTHTQTAAQGCDGVARGRLGGGTLSWSTPLAGYRTDGSLTCDGSLCGKFGAPPAGRTAFHVAPHPVPFLPFVLSGDLKTFTMASTYVSKTEMPQQTAHLTLAGREVRRTCLPAAVCR